MGVRSWIKPRLQDFAMRQMDDLRPETVSAARGEVLEVGFGTALNLRHYGPGVTGVTGLERVDERCPRVDPVVRARDVVQREAGTLIAVLVVLDEVQARCDEAAHVHEDHERECEARRRRQRAQASSPAT